MYAKTLTIVRKYGSKAAAATTALAFSGMAAAQESPLVTAVKEEISKYQTDGVAIATALVIAALAVGLVLSLKRSR